MYIFPEYFYSIPIALVSIFMAGLGPGPWSRLGALLCLSFSPLPPQLIFSCCKNQVIIPTVRARRRRGPWGGEGPWPSF